MKKPRHFILMMLAIMSCIAVFASCSTRPEIGTKAAKKRSDQHLDRVLSAIQNKDILYLESLFSKKALSEVEDFDLGVQRLFAFFDGDVISYEYQATGIDDSKRNGIRTTKKRWWYLVNTSAGEYLFFFLEYPRDESDPSNVGLYMLQVIKAEDKATLLDGGYTILYPGVYVPDEYFKEE